jgi:hypothetical protein
MLICSRNDTRNSKKFQYNNYFSNCCNISRKVQFSEKTECENGNKKGWKGKLGFIFTLCLGVAPLSGVSIGEGRDRWVMSNITSNNNIRIWQLQTSFIIQSNLGIRTFDLRTITFNVLLYLRTWIRFTYFVLRTQIRYTYFKYVKQST